MRRRSPAVRLQRVKLAKELSKRSTGSSPRGLAVPELYACVDLRSGVAECDGTVDLGRRIDTSTRGTKTSSLTARDRAGNERTVTVSYSVF